MSLPASHPTSADFAVELMREAVRANLGEAGRQGLLIDLPPEGEIMVTGDLHGNRRNFDRCVALANLPRRRERHLMFQELVHELDSVDGFCRSHRLVELAAALKRAFPRQVHVLLGNHEFAELLRLSIGKKGRELNKAFEEGGRRLYGARWGEVREAYCAFWMTCPVAIRTPNRILIAHSTPRLERVGDLSAEYLRSVLPAQAFRRNSPVFTMLWGRDYRQASADAIAKRFDVDVLLVGHTPAETGLAVPNTRHVILDCKDQAGQYVLLPLDKPLTQEDVIAQAKKLFG